MNFRSYASLLIMFYIAFFVSSAFANTPPAEPSVNAVPSTSGAIFTAEMRSTIKREVMSKPGVLLDMANMTDNGYTWTNDVVWVGSSLTEADSAEHRRN